MLSQHRPRNVTTSPSTATSAFPYTDSSDAGPAVESSYSANTTAPACTAPELIAAAAHLTQLFGTAVHSAATASALELGLTSAFSAKFQRHWHPTEPQKGCGYRCLLFPVGQLDPLVADAVVKAGIDPTAARMAMPSPDYEMMVWVDPGSVSLRISDRTALLQYIYSGCSPPGSPEPTSKSLSPKASSFTPRGASQSPPPSRVASRPKAIAILASKSDTSSRRSRVLLQNPMMSPPPGLFGPSNRLSAITV